VHTHTNHLGQPIGPALPNWKPPLPPPRAAIEGRFCRLEPLDIERHSAALFEANSANTDGRIWTYMAYGPFPDQGAMLEWLRRCAGSEDPLFLCVEGEGRPLGMVAFMNVRPDMRDLELGNIWYLPEAQRTQVNTEAVYLMLREAFDVLGYRRAEWKCDSLNERSRRAALRLGFHFEGVFRQHMIIKERNRDTAWYALLDGDWPRVRSNFERFLAAPPGTLSLAALNGATEVPTE